MVDRFHRLPRPFRVLVAGLGGYALGVLVKEALVATIALDATYQPFYLGVIAAAYAAGSTAGLVTVLLAGIGQAVALRQGVELALVTTADAVRLALFLVIASAVSLLAGRLQTDRQEAIVRGDRLARLQAGERQARVRAESAEAVAAASLSTLESAVAVVPDPVFVLSPGGDVVLRNPAADRWFADDPPQRLADIAARLVTADDRPAATADLALSDALRVNGTGSWLEPRLTPATRGDLVLVLRDVSQVRDMRAAQDAFVGVLSHELRTPVTTIYGIAQLLARPSGKARAVELADDVQVEAERLKRLVDDLLVLSRVERERLEIGEEPVLLQRVIPAVVDAERRRYPRIRFEMGVHDDLPPVLGDPTYVEQIVRNLVSNAAKYGPEDGLVSVAGASDGRLVTVRVRDQGRGFPEGEAERLFDLFYRAPGAAATASGAGIGLFVARQLVRTMGGRIWATPGPDGGAEFGFELHAVDDRDGLEPLPGRASRGETKVIA